MNPSNFAPMPVGASLAPSLGAEPYISGWLEEMEKNGKNGREPLCLAEKAKEHVHRFVLMSSDSNSQATEDFGREGWKYN